MAQHERRDSANRGAQIESSGAFSGKIGVYATGSTIDGPRKAQIRANPPRPRAGGRRNAWSRFSYPQRQSLVAALQDRRSPIPLHFGANFRKDILTIKEEHGNVPGFSDRPAVDEAEPGDLPRFSNLGHHEAKANSLSRFPHLTES